MILGLPQTSEAQTYYGVPLNGNTFTFDDLGVGGAHAINNLGQVLNGSNRSSSNGEPLAWTNLLTSGFLSVSANAINDSGEVAGSFVGAGGDRQTYAFRSSGNGAPVSLTKLSGFTATEGYAINSSGQVVGNIIGSTYSGPSTAFRTSPTGTGAVTLTFLGTLGGTDSYGYGINDSGQVTGYSFILDDAAFYNAFRSSANGEAVSLTNLGTLGGRRSRGIAINNRGQVAGYSGTSEVTIQHAFRSSANGEAVSLTDLGTLPGSNISRGYGIDEQGNVVGTCTTLPSPDRPETNPVGFLYASDAMYDLNDLFGGGAAGHPGIFIISAGGINDLGQIAGTAFVNNEVHAFRLTVNAVASAPEPFPVAQALLGGLARVTTQAIVLRRRRRRG